MRLLFDNNLSFRLKRLLSDVFPESAHVTDEGFGDDRDETVWFFARDNGFTIVSKDDDFTQLSLYHGAPPKLVLLQVGNRSTDDIATILRESAKSVRAFEDDVDANILVIRR